MPEMLKPDYSKKVRQIVFVQDGVIMGFCERKGAELIIADAERAGHKVQKYFDLYYGRPGFNVVLRNEGL